MLKNRNFESGSDFAAINFDVLNSYFGSIFCKKNWKKQQKKEKHQKKLNQNPVTQNLLKKLNQQEHFCKNWQENMAFI